MRLDTNDLTFIFLNDPIHVFPEKNDTHSLRFYWWFCAAVSVGLKAGEILYCLANQKSTFILTINKSLLLS